MLHPRCAVTFVHTIVAQQYERRLFMCYITSLSV